MQLAGCTWHHNLQLPHTLAYTCMLHSFVLLLAAPAHDVRMSCCYLLVLLAANDDNEGDGAGEDDDDDCTAAAAASRCCWRS